MENGADRTRANGLLVGLAVVGLVALGVWVSRVAMGTQAHHGHAAAATLELFSFFTLGLIGGFGHCVGMCSPFVLFVSRRVRTLPASTGAPAALSLHRERFRVFAAQAAYTAGRIVTYAALGALAGTFGGALESAGGLLGVRRAAAVVAGAVLVVWAVAALSDFWRLEVRGRMFARIGSMANRRMLAHPFATGLFLGLLPCGFLYSAVVAAIGRGGALASALALALFGLGTAPALLGVSLADDLLTRQRVRLNRLSHVFILLMGAWFLWRGLSG
jgi:sulfite exporter TauE/SafE